MVSSHTNTDAGSAGQVGRPIGREANLSDRVAQYLMERVADGTLQRGARLPAERTLAEQFGVSRTVIREAMRALVSRGLLETRGGSGTYVSDDDPTLVAQSMSQLLRLQQNSTPMPYVMVHEVRVVLEAEIAGIAARRARPDDVAALEREIALQRQARAGTDHVGGASSDAAFHEALAAATGNDLFPILVQAINHVMSDVRRLGFTVPGAHDNALAHHERILAAVRARDSAGAIRVMRSHLGDAQSILRQAVQMAANDRG
jgi:GntR family transcriptional repressor for pyruvate dehydrogenase complex